MAVPARPPMQDGFFMPNSWRVAVAIRRANDMGGGCRSRSGGSQECPEADDEGMAV